MKIKAFLLAISICQLVSCNTESEIPLITNENILFGRFYGFCTGEKCIEIFKLTEDRLFEDITDQYPSSTQPYQGNFTALSEEKYQLANHLFDKIPEELLSEADTIIGAPDAADGGGIYFAIQSEKGTRYWLIDQMKQNVPGYLHPFMDEINTSITMISD